MIWAQIKNCFTFGPHQDSYDSHYHDCYYCNCVFFETRTMLTCVLLFVRFSVLSEHISLVQNSLLRSPSPHRDPGSRPLPTFPDIPVSRALELASAQQEAGPVVRVAFPAGGGAEAPGGGAAFVPQDLVDGGAVLIGQGRSVGRRVAIFLGV